MNGRSLARAASLVGGCLLILAACNSHPVDFAETSGAVQRVEPIPVQGGGKVDILWVIDNSGSMCQEQREIRANFRDFIDQLEKNPVDFHIGVTTTHFQEVSQIEPVAKPGRLQSTPSPVTGSHPRCRFAVDDQGNAKDFGHSDGPDFSPVKEQVNQAVECTSNPGKYQKLKNPSDDEIACALFPDKRSKACQRAGMNPDKVSKEDLFPPQDAYEQLPTVLRAKRYRKNGKLNVKKLKRDFACMSFVGTRGHTFEQGLRAATKAVSPQMTGGPADVENPDKPIDKKAPNHGFIRKNAKFGLIFVTDENDCSHRGNAIRQKTRQNFCGEGNCYFPTRKKNDGVLMDTSTLARRFRENLRKSKRVDAIPKGNLVVASIHGKWGPYKGTPPDKCGRGKTGVSPVCRGVRGQAKSGDRYEKFLLQFHRKGYSIFPEKGPAADHLKGWMCQTNLTPAIKAIGKAFRPSGPNCLDHRVFPCDNEDDCPAYQFGGGQGKVCKKWNTDGTERFCDSAAQIWLRATEAGSRKAARKALSETGYCVAKSIGASPFPKGCVVDRSKYDWKRCPGGSGIRLVWKDSGQAQTKLGPFKVQARYAERVETGGEADAGGGETGGQNAGK
ncbi:MAG: hypothetical protein ABEL76_07465 [Bradymonadaceae bacterium]